jgi:hypothetical protein
MQRDQCNRARQCRHPFAMAFWTSEWMVIDPEFEPDYD